MKLLFKKGMRRYLKTITGIPLEIELKRYKIDDLQLKTRDEILSEMVFCGILSYYNGKLCTQNHEVMMQFRKVA